MKTKTTRLEIETTEHTQMVEITEQVRRAVAKSGVRDGVCLVFVPHTTAAVTINENADPDVVRDITMELGKIVPWEDGYRHREGNAAAHLKCSLVGASETVIIENGAPLLGTWQGIWFCEFDGPRRRKALVKVIAED
ncbi:MAG: secondary thiamine-phosphate synthase enzyme YjbQ [Bacillota bacterium]|jgi:secondary thiamine-phosphate synthase enzyme